MPVNKKPDFIPHPNNELMIPIEPEWKKTASKIPEIPVFEDPVKVEQPFEEPIPEQ